MIINKIDRHKRTVVKTAVLLLYSKKLEKLQKWAIIRLEKLQKWGIIWVEKLQKIFLYRMKLERTIYKLDLTGLQG